MEVKKTNLYKKKTKFSWQLVRSIDSIKLKYMKLHTPKARIANTDSMLFLTLKKVYYRSKRKKKLLKNTLKNHLIQIQSK